MPVVVVVVIAVVLLFLVVVVVVVLRHNVYELNLAYSLINNYEHYVWAVAPRVLRTADDDALTRSSPSSPFALCAPSPRSSAGSG